MNEVRTEISKTEYLKYTLNPAEYNRDRKETIPFNWAVGYGWYGCRCYESSNGHYYRLDSIGESCD